MAQSILFQQQEQGWMIYPGRGWRKAMFKVPIYLWRLGLARFTPPNYLLLTTVGRRTGLVRRNMLEYTRVDNCFYLLSGWGHKSQWYHNILANPYVTVQTLRDGTVSGKAVPVTDEQEVAMFSEHARESSPIWNAYLASWGIEDDAQDFVGKRDRLCILRIDPVEAITPPPLAADLTWIWPLLGMMLLTSVGGILLVQRNRASMCCLHT